MAIYESPDGGRTVYERSSAHGDRVLIRKSDDESWDWYLFNKKWEDLAAWYPAIEDKLRELKALEKLCSTSK